MVEKRSVPASDHWYEPQADQHSEWVQMQSQPEPESPPTDATMPTTGDSWVYLNGKMGFGEHHWEIARQLASSMSDGQAEYVSNNIARGLLPPDVNCAVGSMVAGRPQIFDSNVDRNAVLDALLEARSGVGGK